MINPVKRSLRWQFPSSLTLVDSTCLEIRSWLKANHLDAISFGVELVTRECLNNAILHGNAQQAQKKVTVNLSLGKKYLSLQVADEGPGFDWRKAKQSVVPVDCATSGRGLSIARLHARRIQFNRQGNQITLWFPTPNQTS